MRYFLINRLNIDGTNGFWPNASRCQSKGSGNSVFVIMKVPAELAQECIGFGGQEINKAQIQNAYQQELKIKYTKTQADKF